MPRKKRTELAGTKLHWTGVRPSFAKQDNARAWDALFFLLSQEQYRRIGLPYELLARKARNAVLSVGPHFVNYCEELGYLQISQDDRRDLLRPGEEEMTASRTNGEGN